MNDEIRRLEQATGKMPAGDLDADAAALREGWRALAATLEKVNGDFDETAFAAKLRSVLLPEPAATQRPESRTNSTYAGWIVVGSLVGGTLAASLLLALALASSRLGVQRQVVQSSAGANSGTGQESITLPRETNDNFGSISSWDDPLDSQISIAAAQMEHLQRPALQLDASISDLDWQLKRMAQDLDEEAL